MKLGVSGRQRKAASDGENSLFDRSNLSSGTRGGGG